MPAKLERCVRKVKERGGKAAQAAWAICIKSTGLRPEPRSRKRRK